jgi:hypothetical protein
MSAREQAGLRPGEPDLNAAPAGIDTRDMLLIHRVIRREIGRLPGLFRTAGDPARAARITAHASEMLDFLHVHHTGEDELLWPALRRRPSRRRYRGTRTRSLRRHVRVRYRLWRAALPRLARARIAARQPPPRRERAAHRDDAHAAHAYAELA